MWYSLGSQNLLIHLLLIIFYNKRSYFWLLMFPCNHLWLLKPEMDLSELSISLCVWDFSLLSEHINAELLCLALLFFHEHKCKRNGAKNGSYNSSDQKKIRGNTKRSNFFKRENVWGISGFVTLAICFSFPNCSSLLSIIILSFEF